MRIKFTKDTPAELQAVPASAWGCLMKHAPELKPQIEAGGFVFATHGEIEHYFPKGVAVELPDEMANGYVVCGDAELSPLEGGPVEWLPEVGQ